MLFDSIENHLGAGLRRARRDRYPADTQARFAARIGLSRATYQKMEQGDPSVAIGAYLAAAALLGAGDRFASVFDPATTAPDLLAGIEQP